MSMDEMLGRLVGSTPFPPSDVRWAADYFARDGRSEDEIERIITALASAHIPGLVEMIDLVEGIDALAARLAERDQDSNG